ncbi:hypothetical protein BJX70DRAFT_364739 [Aspergillus crustosus]
MLDLDADCSPIGLQPVQQTLRLLYWLALCRNNPACGVLPDTQILLAGRDSWHRVTTHSLLLPFFRILVYAVLSGCSLSLGLGAPRLRSFRKEDVRGRLLVQESTGVQLKELA